MNPRMTKRLRWTATLPLLAAVVLSCSILVPPARPIQTMPTSAPTNRPIEPTKQATFLPLDGTSATEAASTPTAVAPPLTARLSIDDSYPFDLVNGVLGYSMTASPGKVWVGTGTGTVLMIDAGTGKVTRSIQLQTGGGLGNFVTQMGFDGQYVVAFEMVMDSGETPQTQVYAIDSSTGEIAHHWDLRSSEWTQQESDFEAEAFGISPGKIWVDGRVIDTRTFNITQDVPMPAYTRFGYDGSGWMWMTGDTGGSCDDLVFANVDDPSDQVCEADLRFVPDTGPRGGEVVPSLSTMTLAGDTMWMLAGQPSGGNGAYTIVGYPADMEQLMKQVGPQAIVPLMDASSSDIRMVYAGKSLWLAWESGDKRGWLYRLNPRTGATLDSLDLVEDPGREKGEVALDLATEGENLWVLTLYRLIRIRL